MQTKHTRNKRSKPKHGTRNKHKTNPKSEPKKMEELDLDNMPKLNKKSVVMGIIYAKWCQHCKELIPAEGNDESQPKWQQTLDAIRQNVNKKKDVYYLTIEDDEIKNDNKLDKFNEKCKGICDKKLEADGYPTMFKITGGRLEKYSGQREPEIMSTWFLRGNQGSPLPPPITEL